MERKHLSPGKKVLRGVLWALLALVLIAAGYVAYVFIAYHRIGDQPLSAENAAGNNAVTASVPRNTELTVTS